MTESKIALVTGGTGFIGRFAVRALSNRGYEVHVISRSSKRVFAPAPLVRIHQCDLFDAESRRRLVEMVAPSHLLHLAWQTEHDDYWNSPENMNWVSATLGLLRDFHENGGARAVLAGTCAEYDWSRGHCREDSTATEPTSLYGSCKNSLQQIATNYAQHVGLSLAWGRLFFVYGPGEDGRRFVPSMIHSLLSEQRAVCRNKDHLRDYIHVADAADAMAQLLNGGVTGSVNIASGQAVSLGRIANILAEQTGRRHLLQQEAGNVSADNPAQVRAVTERLNTEVDWLPGITLGEGLRSLVKTIRGQAKTKAA